MQRPSTSRRAVLSTLAALSLAGFAGACGSSAKPEAKAAASPAAEARTVTIDTFQFSPKRIQVRVGDTVTWTNHDSILHTVTSGTRTYDPGDSGRVTETRKDGMFDTPLDGRGSSTRFTFTKTGTFHYFCDRHPGMEADVEVS